MVDIGLIFTAMGTAKSVAQMMGMIDSLDAKVDRLTKSELNAGFRNLEQASASQGEQEHLLREARSCFNRAASLETGHRRGLALLGCALCHHHLGDAENCRKLLEEIIELPPPIGPFSITAVQATYAVKEVTREGFRGILRGYCSLAYRRLKLMVSQQERVAYKKEMILEAVQINADAKSLLLLQQSASRFLGQPVRWLVDLENGKSPLFYYPVGKAGSAGAQSSSRS